jgi:hypothetical protein
MYKLYFSIKFCEVIEDIVFYVRKMHYEFFIIMSNKHLKEIFSTYKLYFSIKFCEVIEDIVFYVRKNAL